MTKTDFSKCRVIFFESNPTIKAGDWKIQLKRPYQSYNDTVNLIESWSPKLDIKVTGNVTIESTVPNTAASNGTTIITGSLLEDENIPVQGDFISVEFNDNTYYGLTNENGIFTIQLDTPEVEDENYDIIFRFNGTENLTEQITTKNIRIINASVDLSFDQTNEDIFERHGVLN